MLKLFLGLHMAVNATLYRGDLDENVDVIVEKRFAVRAMRQDTLGGWAKQIAYVLSFVWLRKIRRPGKRS